MAASIQQPALHEKTIQPETWRIRLFRWRLNHFPAFWCTGGRITYLSPDFREAHLDLPLNRRTRNLVGTMFGGSMFAATDAIYMVMLIRLMGRDHIVWDKGGTIRFLKPGRGTLHACYSVPEEETDAIKAALQTQRSIDRVYSIELKDDADVTCALIERTVYIRKKEDKDLEQKAAISA